MKNREHTVVKLLSMLIATLFLVVMVASAAFSQGESGQINGKVTDPQDRVVPGATVTVKSVTTGAERTTTTDDQGVYTVPSLQPGLYDVTVKAGQFAENTQRAQVTVGAKLSLDTKLSTQAVAANVNVIAGEGGIEVNTQDQQLSNVVTQQQVREIPTLTRNPYDLVGISGNVTADSGGRGTGYAINGQRSASTSILLDGTENVDTFTATVGQAVPLDSVQEFRVITGNFSAEYGRASGGIVNVATIAGTNEFHGTLYEFNRISRLASNGFSNNAFGIAKQVFTRNQYGYSIGGPVILPRFGEGGPSTINLKNKLFFFSNTEWIKVRSGGARTAWVPTPQFLAASSAQTRAFFAPYQVNGTLGPTISASQVVAAFGASTFVPTPNSPGTNRFLAFANANPSTPVFQQVNFSTPRDVGGGLPENEYQTVNRVDYNHSDKSQLYVRYALQSVNAFEGTNAYSPYAGFSTGFTNFNQNALLNLTHSFSSNFVSQTKLAFNRLNGGQPLGQQPLVPTLYMQDTRTVTLQGVQVLFPGYLPYSPGNAIPFAGAQNVYQANEDMSYSMGKHNWKFGGQFIQIRDNKTFGAYSYAVETLGNTNGEALSNFITGNLVRFSVAIDPGNRFPGASIPLPVGPPSFSRSNRYNEWAAYLNDSWRIRPNVTLNLGLRYEYYGVQHNTQDPHLDANFYYGAGSTQQERIANGRFFAAPDSPIGQLWNPDRNNFAPRVGLAWDMFGDGRTSLRGGYGIAYERNFGNVTFNLMFNPPNYGVVALSANAVSGAGDVATLPVNISNYGPFSGTGPARLFSPVSARHIDENIHNAYAHFWSGSFEHQMGSSSVVSVEYSGSAGRQLYSIGDQNRTGARPFFGLPNIPNAVGALTSRLNPFVTSMNTRRNDGWSNYHGLITSFESNNFRNTGLTFTARYTLSRAKDNLSSTFADTAQTFFLGFTDQFHPEYDYGPADFDVRHRFASSFVYAPTFFDKSGNAVSKHLLGGWSLNGTVILRSGYPVTIYDCTFASITCARLDPSGAVTFNNSNPPDAGSANSFTLADLSNQTRRVPANPLVGNYNFGPYPSSMTGRNVFRGPGFWNIDTGLYKRIRFSEQYSLQLRAEVFNLFNHANLLVDYGSPEVNSGSVLGLRDGRRNVQLAAKFIF
jgi:outer membrane receptor protein involved in Fe transport